MSKTSKKQNKKKLPKQRKNKDQDIWPKCPTVQVEWEDAYSQATSWGSNAAEEMERKFRIRSVGYLIRNTPKYILLAFNYSYHTGHYADYLRIPRGWAKIRRVKFV